MSHSPLQASEGAEGDYLAGWLAMTELIRGTKSWSGRERHCGFLNQGNGAYSDVSAVLGWDLPDDGRGLALTDWDRDGALDVWLSNRTGPRLRFLRNTMADSSRGFLALRLEGVTCNRDAVGARVEVTFGEQRGMKTLHAGDGYLAQSSKWLHFGTGEASLARVRVHWPGGEPSHWVELATSRRYHWKQGESPRVAELDSPVLPSAVVASSSVSESSAARVVLADRVPFPPLHYEHPESGEPQLLQGRSRQPLLLHLWGSWCVNCLPEMEELAAHRDWWKKHRVRVVALSADEERTRPDAEEFLSRIGWTHEAGFASGEVSEALDVLQKFVLDRQRRLPLPATFLIDSKNRLASMFLGPVDWEALKEDLGHLRASPREMVQRAAPFPGQWLGQPPPLDPLDLAALMSGSGLDRLAQDYRKSLRTTASKKTDPEVVAAVDRGGKLAQQGKPDEAVRVLSAAVERDPGYARGHYRLGLAEMSRREWGAACAAFEAAASVSKNPATIHYYWAQCLERLGEPLAALGHYQQALASDLVTHETLFRMANLAADGGAIVDAVGYAGQALDRWPQYTEARRARGQWMGKLGRWNEAVEEFEQALSIEADDAECLFGLGSAFLRLGKAEAVTELVSRLQPLDAELAAELSQAAKRSP